MRKAYRELHRFDTASVPGVEFYSSGWEAYVPDRESARRDRSPGLGPVDFPRVIRAAYDAGVRTFIEVGPAISCSRMIDRTWKASAPRALARGRGAGSVTHFLRTLAELHAAGVTMNADMLRGGTLPS